MRWTLVTVLWLVACGGHPGKNEVVARKGREVELKANVTKATFDGNLTILELGPRVTITIASCYAHAQQQIGDRDHVSIQLDHKEAKAGELDIADCTTSHVVASLWAEFEGGTKLEASIDSDLKKTR